MIIGAASFNERECKGNPETSKEFKNSRKCTAWDSSSTGSVLDRLTRQLCYQGSVNSSSGFVKQSQDAPLRKPSHTS